MQDIFLASGFTAADRAAAERGVPGTIYFLTKEFITRYWAMAALPPERLNETVEFAAKLQCNAEYRALVWHLYLACCIRFPEEKFPEELAGFGIDTGKIYLLVLLSLIPFYEERAAREGFPLRYAHAAAERIGTSTVFYAQKFAGAFGIRARSMAFMIHYKSRPCFRIGRFDFEPWKYDDFLPEIYACGDETIALCQDGWKFDARGERTSDETRTVRTVRLVRSGDTVTGTPIDPAVGYAKDAEITLDLARWTRLAGPGDWTIHFHIPGGGHMTPEACAASFAEAKEFFASYFPDKPSRIIWSNSWIFAPAYREYLPESNIAKLGKSGSLFPVASAGNDGLYFVFGRDDTDFDTYECKTSLQKAVMRYQREQGFLRRAGWYITIK